MSDNVVGRGWCLTMLRKRLVSDNVEGRGWCLTMLRREVGV